MKVKSKILNKKKDKRRQSDSIIVGHVSCMLKQNKAKQKRNYLQITGIPQVEDRRKEEE